MTSSSSTVRAVPASTEGLRSAAHDIAKSLCASDVGGECYHGGRHTCFTRQGRKPLPLYKVEEMCERCAASWHAVMAAALLDSVIIGQQFLGSEPQLVLGTENGENGATVHGKALPAKRLDAFATTRKKSTALAVAPRSAGKYSTEERVALTAHYKSLSRSAKAAFNLRYGVKAWQMRDWAKK